MRGLYGIQWVYPQSKSVANHIAHLTALQYVNWKQEIVFPLPLMIGAATMYPSETSRLLYGLYPYDATIITGIIWLWICGMCGRG
jgi:hypothetical protein